MSQAKSYKKAVILGAAGFIGINLAHLLAEQGFELVCFDRNVAPQWPKSAKVITGDFASLPERLMQELDHALVFHLISSCRPSPGTAQAADEVGHDVVTTIRYLEETKMRDLRWIFLSSGGTVYGQNNEESLKETSPTNPICSYAVVKLAIEQYFALYRTMYGVDYVIVRLANPYGPWQVPGRGQGVISTMLYKALKGEVIDVWGDGENVRDYIYIVDAVEGILAATLAGGVGEIYNIGTSSGRTLNQLIDVVSEALNVRLVVNYSPARTVDVRKNVLDASKLFSRTGWEPKTSINSGVRLTASWINSLDEG